LGAAALFTAFALTVLPRLQLPGAEIVQRVAQIN
jgi:hypothetical protein